MAREQEQGRCYQEIQSMAAALACLAVLYAVMPRLPRGLPRLLLLLPCLPVFAWVPFSTRLHSLRALLTFPFLWICPSKLLLLSWDLSPDFLGHGFLYFVLTTLLPLRVKRKAPTSARTQQGALFPFLLFLAGLNACTYRESLSVWAVHALYCLQVFLGLQWGLGLSANLAIVLLGVEVYPHFDKPFLASSLSDFWGRRWNLVTSHMLRETVYSPTLRILSRVRWQVPMKRTLDIDTKQSQPLSSNAKSKENTDANKSVKIISKQQKLQEEISVGKGYGEFGNMTKPPLIARSIAMLASFLVSGLIHELIFCCVNQAHATWEVTMFFILHGFATVLEVFLKRKLPAHWKLPRPVSILCTLGFLFFSAVWLFMPPITRAGSELRIIAEYYHVQSVISHLFKKHYTASMKMLD